MTELEALIRQKIEREGPLSVAHYMQLALTHPDHGYYMKGDPLGVGGDFTTAPEISQMFGELIGLWCAEVWNSLGKPDPFVCLELGPGRGTLMQDALRATAKIKGFHDAMRLCLMETNETLRVAQQEKLKEQDVTYLSDVSELPPLPTIVLANEFFDALPVHQYMRTPEGWRERMVGLQGEKFVFALDHNPVPLPLPEDKDFYEVSPLGVALVQHLAAHFKAYRGAALIVDYGACEGAYRDTLQAVSGHAFAPVLERPGAVDLTAHVDYTALALAAQREGARVFPCVTQMAFLHALGIEVRAWQLKLNADYDQAHAIDAGFERLTDPDKMGALFKVFAFASADLAEVPGFP
ncbi:MAG: class I SAM-dependent methyltransferase [Bdellovibrionales bacterium]